MALNAVHQCIGLLILECIAIDFGFSDRLLYMRFVPLPDVFGLADHGAPDLLRF